MPTPPLARVSHLALALALALVPQASFAADAADAPDEDQDFGNQILVTAQKIEQRAQDVPITISAVTGARIRDLGVADLDELSSYIPGSTFRSRARKTRAW
jgi:outer membrane receptor protein involved in Fe transport